MSDYFNCKLCDKSIKIKSKKKHLNSQYHKDLCMSIKCRHSVTNPDFLHTEDTLKNYVDCYYKKFGFYLILCKGKLHFTNTIINIKSDRLYKFNPRGWNLRIILLSKIECFESYEYKFSHISEMKFTFITDLRNMTYEHYLNQPKSMMEWRLNAKIAINAKLTEIFENRSHPLIRRYQRIYDGEN